MKKPFNTLTKNDVEKLRRKSLSVTSGGVIYNFTDAELNNAVSHLEHLYGGTVRKSFAAKILLLNKIY